MTSINGFIVGSASTCGVKTFRVPGTSVYLPVRADIAPLLIGFAGEFNRRVEALHVGWNWGYAYRAVIGGSTPSFHAAGIAIDLNAPRHPLSVVGTFSGSQRSTINALIGKYGLRWGGNYSGRKDEMHFEVIKTHAEALALVRRLQGSPTAPTRITVVLREGSTGPNVVRLQRALHITADGQFGPGTKAAVAAFQRSHGLTADGVAGPNTLHALGLA